MKIIFRNLERSEFAIQAVESRLGDMVDKFPKLKGHKITVTLFMENSPVQPGLDSFGVRLLIQGVTYKTISLCKTSPILYQALADVREHLLEALNRTGDKERVLKRKKERRYRNEILTKEAV